MTTGRPSHKPTATSRGAVEVMSGFGVPQDKICLAIGISSRTTLLKHYAEELERGGAMLEATLVGNLLRIAKGSDGTALKAIMFSLRCRFGWSEYAPRDSLPLGKKAQAQADAEEEPDPESDWAKLLQ